MTNNSQLITNNHRKSFTLIELLVVLALVAILSVVVVLTLNPAELIKQARDSNRLSDLATINTALNLFSTDVTGGFMGTSTVVYVSLPDNASSTCGSWGLPALPAGYNYSCVTTANLRNTDGTGWIPVNLQRISSNSPISQLPIDPINTTSTLSYYTYVTGGSWKLSATLEAQKNITVLQSDGGTSSIQVEIGSNVKLAGNIFPSGWWVKVPGNSTFGTSDFWAMKYEAKCADSSGNLLTSPSTAFRGYSSNTAPCTMGNGKYLTSAPEGYPTSMVTRDVAASYCQEIGAHLITNNEWQTIAWNIQNNSQNWSGGSVGSGYVYSGHNDSGPSYNLTASTNDTDGYFGTGQSSGNQKRTHVLSNGQIIWDIAGNAYERISETIVGTNKPVGTAGVWVQWTAVSNWGSMTQQTAGPADASWSSTQGIGQYYQGTADGSTYGFFRGGSLGGGAVAGVESLVAVVSPGDWTYGDGQVGFRCAR